MNKERIYRIVASCWPSKMQHYIAQQLLFAAQAQSWISWLGSSTILSLLVFSMALLFPLAYVGSFDTRFIFLGLFLGGLTFGILLLYLRYAVDHRTKDVEAALPDALQLMAANLHAGMTPFQALQLSARKEFGPLSHEIHHATKRAFGTASFDNALLQIAQRVPSETLERSMKLFARAMRSGGHLAPLLEELGKDIGETRSLKREFVTQTKTYALFILFTVLLGAPILFAVSIQFLGIVTAMQQQVNMNNTFGIGFLSGDVAISVGFVQTVSIVMLLLTGILASVLIGVIRDGTLRSGLRYSPFMMSGSLLVFFIAKTVIGNLL
ncbi:type II secretion system F family protein [Candidatus Woesearchaeota archaeon]|nr:type II secretion system F family protein [Candidatus Woesearchaeota archaeon]